MNGGKSSSYYVYDTIIGGIFAVPVYINTNEKASGGGRIEPALNAPAGLAWKGHVVQTVFDLFIEESASFTPDWAAAITDVPAATIRRIAIEFGQARPAMVDPGWMMSGEYHHRSEKAWHNIQHGIDNSKEPPVERSGMGFAHGLLDIFGNLAAWEHGKPAFSFAWAMEQKKAGKPSAFLPAMADVGLYEAVRGELTFNGQLTGKAMSAAEAEATIRTKGVLLLKSAAEVVEEMNLPRKLPVPTMSGRLELFSPILESFTQKRERSRSSTRCLATCRAWSQTRGTRIRSRRTNFTSPTARCRWCRTHRPTTTTRCSPQSPNPRRGSSWGCG
jgi:hypothetical protein